MTRSVVSIGVVSLAVACSSDPLDEPPDFACGPASSSPAVPDGWVRFPGMPCECQLRVAPSPGDLGPPPTWVARADGILELDPADGGVAPASLAGDSYYGTGLLSFVRNLGPMGEHANVLEHIVLSLPSNEVLFEARDPDGGAGVCWLFSTAGQGMVLHGAQQTAGSGGRSPAWALAGGPARAGVPDLLHAEGGAGVDSIIQAAIGRDIVAILLARGADALRPQLFTLALEGAALLMGPITNEYEYLSGAWNSAVFLQHDDTQQEDGHRVSSVSVWGAAHGLQPLLGATVGDSPGETSACGLGSDGEDMVWTQHSSWNGTSWEEIDLMRAAFTTQPSQLEAEKVRAVLGDPACGAWHTDGGMAVQYPLDVPSGSLMVRLADGQAFLLPDPPPDRSYGAPLYVNDQEVAVAETLRTPEGDVSTIARVPLSLLGEGIPGSELP